MEELIVRAHLFVSGRVQGVFYRKHVQEGARSLRLVGWARNTIDGRVEIVVEGKKEQVEQFLKECKEGSTLAQVQDIEIEYEKYTGEFTDFEVREFGF